MEKYSARHCLRHNLAVHYAANNSVQHTQTPNTAANNRVSLRDERKKYTQSSIHIALSRPEPIEKSVQGRCRAVCPAQGVQRGDEIHPCASHGCECLSSQKRLLRGGYYAARSRTQGRGGQGRERNYIFQPDLNRGEQTCSAENRRGGVYTIMCNSGVLTPRD